MANKPNKRNGVKKHQLKQKKSAGGKKSFPAIQQGTGQSVRKAFGNSKGSLRNALCAYHPAHLSLPIATGGYTTVRVTQLISSNDRVTAFGTFKGSLELDGSLSDSTQSGWAPYCAVSDGVGGLASSPVINARFWRMNGIANLGPMATIVPSALSVQIMNPQALQTTNGILYIGRMTTQLRGEDEVSSWESLGNEFVSYQAPRLCSAGKLALRGVTIDAAPFNMSELMDFERIQDPHAPPDTAAYVDTSWTSVSSGTDPEVNSRWHMKGFSPIMAYNPAGVGINYLVTMELRVRFDLGHPASSTHRVHAPSSHATWGKAIADMVNAGHGVMDIAERVANFGSQIEGSLQLAGRALPAIGM